jgi:alanine dehydrogenase
MIVGIPKEIKTAEKRVAMTPQGVDSLVSRGRRVLVEKGAGEGSGFPDGDYEKALAENEILRRGLNLIDGHVVCEGVANSFGLPFLRNPFDFN